MWALSWRRPKRPAWRAECASAAADLHQGVTVGDLLALLAETKERRAMRTGNHSQMTQRAPKQRPRHYAYDTELDEPAGLVEKEGIDIEQETPSEDSEPIGRPDREGAPSPAFEE